MKRILEFWFYSLLTNFKWFRKYKGGTWYLVVYDEGGGLTPTLQEWTQVKPNVDDEETVIIETEIY